MPIYVSGVEQKSVKLEPGTYYTRREVRQKQSLNEATIESQKNLLGEKNQTIIGLQFELQETRRLGDKVIRALQEKQRECDYILDKMCHARDVCNERNWVSGVFRRMSGYKVMVPIVNLIHTSNGWEVEIR